mgnify:CR=1 FL=1
MQLLKAIPAGAIVAMLAAWPANAQDMTGAELHALLDGGKTIKLGGKGEGYSGTLNVKGDGKASGKAKTDDGSQLNISGTWTIKGDKFCRKWKALDGGKQVCETWKKNGPNSAEVFVGSKRAGLNSW